MNLIVQELRARLKAAQDRFTLLRLREELTAFIASSRFEELPISDRNQIEDLLVEVLAKEEQYKGCDPWRAILGY